MLDNSNISDQLKIVYGGGGGKDVKHPLREPSMLILNFLRKQSVPWRHSNKEKKTPRKTATEQKTKKNRKQKTPILTPYFGPLFW